MSRCSELNERYNSLTDYTKIRESAAMTAKLMKNEPILTGKVRIYNPKEMRGIIVGDDNVMYDIQLSMHDKSHKELSAKIKKGMKIKFKDLDTEPPMAYIDGFSFK